MKIITVLLAVLCCLGLVSCSSEEDLYECVVYDTALDGAVSADTSAVFWPTEYFVDTSVPPSVTAEFDGEVYEVDYSRSLYVLWEPYAVHDYECDAARLTFDSENRLVEYYRYLDVIELSQLPNLENPHDDAQAIAERYAAQCVDLSEYIIRDSGTRTYDDREDEILYQVISYQFWFEKYVDGLPTTDRIFVEVSEKGTLIAVAISCRGMFDHLPEGSIDTEKLMRSVENRIESVCKEKWDTYEYEITQNQLAHTVDGNLVLVSSVNLTFDGGLGSKVRLITLIDDAPKLDVESAVAEMTALDFSVATEYISESQGAVK